MAEALQLVLSCEHGGNRVPARYRQLFSGKQKLLESHRGWDEGALDLARTLARTFGVPLVATTTTRLVVDVNRTPSNPKAFSEFTSALSKSERQEILARFHAPHWQTVEATAAGLLSAEVPVVHLSVHTFTPVMDGKRRSTDVGLLYDPARASEERFVAAWHQALGARAPELTVHRNRPYRGTSDGLTRALRLRLADPRYAGIELEVNQRHAHAGAAHWRRIKHLLAASLAEALAAGGRD